MKRLMSRVFTSSSVSCFVLMAHGRGYQGDVCRLHKIMTTFIRLLIRLLIHLRAYSRSGTQGDDSDNRDLEYFEQVVAVG